MSECKSTVQFTITFTWCRVSSQPDPWGQAERRRAARRALQARRGRKLDLLLARSSRLPQSHFLLVVAAAQRPGEPRIRERVQRRVQRRVLPAHYSQQVQEQQKHEPQEKPATAATAATAHQRARLPLARDHVHVLAANVTQWNSWKIHNTISILMNENNRYSVFVLRP